MSFSEAAVTPKFHSQEMEPNMFSSKCKEVMGCKLAVFIVGLMMIRRSGNRRYKHDAVLHARSGANRVFHCGSTAVAVSCHDIVAVGRRSSHIRSSSSVNRGSSRPAVVVCSALPLVTSSQHSFLSSSLEQVHLAIHITTMKLSAFIPFAAFLTFTAAERMPCKSPHNICF